MFVHIVFTDKCKNQRSTFCWIVECKFRFAYAPTADVIRLRRPLSPCLHLSGAPLLFETISLIFSSFDFAIVDFIYNYVFILNIQIKSFEIKSKRVKSSSKIVFLGLEMLIINDSVVKSHKTKRCRAVVSLRRNLNTICIRCETRWCEKDANLERNFCLLLNFNALKTVSHSMRASLRNNCGIFSSSDIFGNWAIPGEIRTRYKSMLIR